MKKILTLIMSTAVLLACFCGCEEENTIQATTRNTTTEKEVVESSKTEVSESTQFNGLEYEFRLGNDKATAMTLKVGDKIGDWTMSEIGSYSLDHPDDPSYVQVTFTGDVTLKGHISQFETMDGPNGHLQFTMDKAENIPVYNAIEDKIVWAEIQNNFEDLKDDLGTQTIDCNLDVEIVVSSWQVNYLPLDCWDKITIKQVKKL